MGKLKGFKLYFMFKENPGKWQIYRYYQTLEEAEDAARKLQKVFANTDTKIESVGDKD